MTFIDALRKFYIANKIDYLLYYKLYIISRGTFKLGKLPFFILNHKNKDILIKMLEYNNVDYKNADSTLIYKSTNNFDLLRNYSFIGSSLMKLLLVLYDICNKLQQAEEISSIRGLNDLLKRTIIDFYGATIYMDEMITIHFHKLHKIISITKHNAYMFTYNPSNYKNHGIIVLCNNNTSMQICTYKNNILDGNFINYSYISDEYMIKPIKNGLLHGKIIFIKNKNKKILIEYVNGLEINSYTYDNKHKYIEIYIDKSSFSVLYRFTKKNWTDIIDPRDVNILDYYIESITIDKGNNYFRDNDDVRLQKITFRNITCYLKRGKKRNDDFVLINDLNRSGFPILDIHSYRDICKIKDLLMEP